MSLSIQRNPVSELELQLPCCCTPMIGDGRRVLFSPDTLTFTVESHLSALVPKCCMSVFQQEKRNREDLLTRNAIREILSTSRMNHLIEEGDSNNPTGPVTYAYFRSLQKKIFSLWQQTVVDTILVDKPVRNPLEGLPTDSSECDLNPLSTSRRINHSDTSSNDSSMVSENEVWNLDICEGSDPNLFIENPLLRDQPRNFREDAVPQDQEAFVAEQSYSLEGLLAHLTETPKNEESTQIPDNKLTPAQRRFRQFRENREEALRQETPKNEQSTQIPDNKLTPAQRRFRQFRENRAEALRLERKAITSPSPAMPSRAIREQNESPRMPSDSLGLSGLRTGQAAFPQSPSSGGRVNKREIEICLHLENREDPLPEMCESIGSFSDESRSH